MELRELIARAINEQPGTVQRNYRPTADAILAAFDAAGLVVVPREPTEEMLAASQCECGNAEERDWYITHDYAAMLSASPYAKKEVE